MQSNLQQGDPDGKNTLQYIQNSFEVKLNL